MEVNFIMIPVYVEDIKYSLENKCYFAALSLALMLPDICGIAEFPDKSVAERYMGWYDKYLGDYMAYGKNDLGGNNPWLSGEVVYNLRNTYFHQGNPGILSDKIKEEVNQFDKFVLMLGDGTVLQEAVFNLETGIEKTGKITYRAIIIDVTYLCDCICECALQYYENNQEQFKFNFEFITQEEFIHLSEEEMQFSQGDIYANILNQKLEKKDSIWRFVEDPDHDRKRLARMKEDLEVIFSDEATKQRFLNGESKLAFSHLIQPMVLVKTENINIKKQSQEKTKSKKKTNNIKNERKKKQSTVKVSKEKREARVRSFFGKHFKKQIYLNKKEEIIQSVLKSKTKQQVNNNLLKHFTSKEVNTIYQRLEPLLKDLPGK